MCAAIRQDVRIYDLVSQTSLQSFYHMALIRGLGHNAPTAAYVNNVALTLIVAVDSSLAVMVSKDDDVSALTYATHNCRVNAVLYNPLFKLVSPSALPQIVHSPIDTKLTQTINRFSTFFTDRFFTKFAIKLLLKIPSHFICVACSTL